MNVVAPQAHMTGVQQHEHQFGFTIPIGGDPYAVHVCGPMHALLIAAERLVAAGYTFDQIKFALEFAMEAECQIQQEQPRDE